MRKDNGTCLRKSRHSVLIREVCPKPSCLKPVIKVDTQGASSLSNDSKKRKCSHCKKLGHCKTKNGKILCPDLLEN